ncbi:MAG: TetR/AcrR family transcriptional regulator [Pseudomonadota bacterium]
MTTRGKRPGRPQENAAGTDPREALLDEACRLFAAEGVDAVSLRRVAAAAGVTPAMVSYYFGNKEGLAHAALERGLEHLLEVVENVAASEDDTVTSTFIDRYIRAIVNEPYLPQLMVREVLGGKVAYQQVIMERFARRVLALMPGRIAADMARGRIRADLDPRLTMLSVVGMCVFPFLAAPLLRPILGFEYDERFAEVLIAHTRTLFTEGGVPHAVQDG